ncbi:hypothetical protein FOZ63_016430, partial [Perkinsus olseni]
MKMRASSSSSTGRNPITTTSRRSSGSSRGRDNTTTVTWVDDITVDKTNTYDRRLRSIQWIKLHCLKEWATELILEGLFPATHRPRENAGKSVFGSLGYLKGWWDALLRAHDNNDDVMAKEIGARFNTAIQEGLLQVMMDTDDDDSDDTGVMHVYRKSQEAWLAAMSSTSPRLSSRILDALTKPLILLWDWLNNEDRSRQEEAL